MVFINPLVILSLTSIIGIIGISFTNSTNFVLLKRISLNITSLNLLISLLLWLLFDTKTGTFQFCTTLKWIPLLNLHYTIGIDGISLFFLILTTFLVYICILISWNSVVFFLKEYLLCFLILEFCLIQVFCVLDIFLFYIFFESTLIPMFLIIGMWGSRSRKIRAAYQFFLYTLIGSLLMLSSLVYIFIFFNTTDVQILTHCVFTSSTQLWIWLAFFTSFAVKIPMIPFHLWLPEAHAEAPTAGSVILAGILLKIGGYGFLRFSIPLLPFATIFFNPLVFTLSLLAIVYGSFTTLRQIDLKKIIAYSSISHMGFVTLGIFSINTQGIEGSIILMLSHGLISSALFICVGTLYDRYKTRIIKYYSGLVQVMPIFTIFFIFFSFSNIGFPGTSSFIGELSILIGITSISFILTFLATCGIIFAAAYSIWLVNRINFGSLNLVYFVNFQDICRREFYVLCWILILVLWLGIYPYLFLNELHFVILNLVEHLVN
nr:NADH dehydrogenase subunit 4 [Pleonosporium sp.]